MTTNHAWLSYLHIIYPVLFIHVRKGGMTTPEEPTTPHEEVTFSQQHSHLKGKSVDSSACLKNVVFSYFWKRMLVYVVI